MIKNMSKREKILMFSAGLLLISYLVVQFAIYPMFSRYTSAGAELLHLDGERFDVEMDIAALPLTRDLNDSVHERLNALREAYPKLVTNEDIDVLMTNLVIRHNLSPTLLSISRPPAQADNEAELEFFTHVTVTMNLIGSLDSLQGLVREVKNTNFMRITTLSHSESTEAATLSTQSITFELLYVSG